MVAPAYDIGEIVYLRESAGIGHLEAVRISGVARHGNTWLYTVSTTLSNPHSASHYGDKIAAVNSKLLYFTETEFITKCEALSLSKANAERILLNLNNQIEALCEEV